MTALLEIADVSRNFGGLRAISHVSLNLQAGEVVGLIGPNGAGKTTLFNCISGLVPADSGRVVFDGHEITRWRPDRISGIGLIRTFQIARGIPRLSVLENLLLYGAHQPGESLGIALMRTQAMLARETALCERARSIAERLNLTCSKVGNPCVYDNAVFPWAVEIEREWPAIRAELDRILVRKDELPGFHEIAGDVSTITRDSGWKT